MTAFVLTCAPAALADSTDSSNWAGYAVHRSRVSFHKVSAAWRQPRASCQVGQPTYSVMWVGLGGYSPNSNALEQVGTELDCSRSGRVISSAWYELVPARSTTIRLTVRPGDLVRASVSVVGRRVTVVLYDLTRHRGFHKTLLASSRDVSSAEWILEAPSGCTSTWACQTLPLANFGSAAFGSAQAQSSTGHSGSITDSAWRSTKIRLIAGGPRYVTGGQSGSALATATPSPLRLSGTWFRVTYAETSTSAARSLATRLAGYLVHTGL